jgi:predicted PurR-regulated permease PerM
MAKSEIKVSKTVSAAQLAREDETARLFKRQIIFWICAVIAFGLFLYVFSSILLPFVVGMTLAYFLDPVADRLERLGLSRMLATLVILVSFIVIFVLALMIFVPILVSQLADFAVRLPGYIAQLQALIASQNAEWIKKVIGVDASVLKNGLGSLVSEGAGFVSTLIASVWSSSKTIIDIAGLFIVTPVVAFYTLYDWDRMVSKVDEWIPRDHLSTVRVIFADINTAIAGFVRGQGTLCFILGLLYAAGLTLVGLNFALLIGLFAGLISFIPYVGSLVGLVLALGVAIVQFWPDWIMVGAVALVFFIGQFIEGNILQPKLVGQSVGLHPVWLMFALFAFGALFGFVGLMVAVPAAAAVGVLVRFAISRYMASPLYRGHGQAKT